MKGNGSLCALTDEEEEDESGPDEEDEDESDESSEDEMATALVEGAEEKEEGSTPEKEYSAFGL